ncbi:hypothetical protein [Ornithinibacillus sp. JPR2-1]|uniref:hypothetical protein n=1 Tax=Ornithinibacillus sp. JPR2-1 TaxID=2094019 RepID=UPI0031D54466
MRRIMKYRFIVIIALVVILAGCTTKESGNNDNLSQEDVDTEPEEYIPSETDVVFKHNALRNVELLEEFIETAGGNGEDNESHIRIVKYEPQGALIYDLQSRYDENANQSWIEVKPDLSYFNTSEVPVQDVFYNAPEQCWYMSKDTEKGYYKFHECRTHWEYYLFPIVSNTLSYEELINPAEEEKYEIMNGKYYDLEDITLELFTSKRDAEKWKEYDEKDKLDKRDNLTSDNALNLIAGNVDLTNILGNEVLVTSCEDGLCDIYSEQSHLLRGFIVPEIRINKYSAREDSENKPEYEVNIDKELLWGKIKRQVESLLAESEELITMYENGDYKEGNYDDAKLLYNKVNGRVNIIRHTSLPDDKETVAEYYRILMATEYLFNSFYQAQSYIEQRQEKDLRVLVKEEIIPLREELQVVWDAVNIPR